MNDIKKITPAPSDASSVPSKAKPRTKRSIRDIPLTKKTETAPFVHIEIHEEDSDFIQATETKNIKHLTPVYGDITEKFPADSFDEFSDIDPTDKDSEFKDMSPSPKKPEPAFESLESFASPDELPIKNTSTPRETIQSDDHVQSQTPPKVKSSSTPTPSTARNVDGFGTNKKSTYRRDAIEEEGEEDLSDSAFEPLHVKKHSRATRTVLLSVIGVFAISALLLHTVFSKADINVTLSNEPIVLTAQVLAEKIPYQTFTKTETVPIVVDRVETVAVSQKAKGQVVLYNNFSTEPYALIKTTRLETANGSIYRLLSDVQIPGKKTVGGETVPGSVSVNVEADKPGDIYNARGGTELRLPGLVKGTTRYTQIYAKTSANFTGGRVGTAPDLGSSEIASATAQVTADVQEKVRAEFIANNPQTIILKDGLKTTSVLGAPKKVDAGTEISVTVTSKIIALDATVLQSEISKVTIDKKLMPTIDELNQFSYEILETPQSDILNGLFSISASGTFKGQSSVTTESIVSTLTGKPVESARELLVEQYPGATVEIRSWPFWKNSIPASADKVTITIN